MLVLAVTVGKVWERLGISGLDIGDVLCWGRGGGDEALSGDVEGDVVVLFWGYIKKLPRSF